MPRASAISLDLKDYGITTFVPDNDIARIMYYLNCVTAGVGIDILQDDLVRYKQYNLLSQDRTATVLEIAMELTPDLFIDKILFRDDEGKVTGDSLNSFISISTACDIVSLQSDIVIAGSIQKVTKVMFFKSSWLKKFYTDPMLRIARTLLGTKHCTHCDGERLICTCTTCPRGPESKCQSSLFETLLETIISAPASNSTPASRRAPSPEPSNDKHQCNCDGCGWQFFTGIRYRCTVCDDYDLCSRCYNRNVHDLTHAFMQINKPGGQPIYLAARKAPTPSRNPISSFFKRTSSNAALGSPIHNQQATSHHPPSLSPFFYNTMSITELKTFLMQHEVEFEALLDREALCRQAWDTYCDCMTIAELDLFLSDMKISTVGCRDVAGKRRKAKNAFESPTKPSRPTSSDTTTIRIRKDDTVVLTGLNRPEMNGKTAMVISVDHAEGKALVKVEGSDKTFKIKLEKLMIVMEDDVEEVEELE